MIFMEDEHVQYNPYGLHVRTEAMSKSPDLAPRSTQRHQQVRDNSRLEKCCLQAAYPRGVGHQCPISKVAKQNGDGTVGRFASALSRLEA